MILACPSCGTQHKTEEYPGAFEINCVCGYSILVPDEAALSKNVEDTRYDDSAPTSMDEEDREQAIKPIGDLNLDGVDSVSEAIAQATGSQQMTPPDQLPQGMVYDPFELPQVPTGSELSSLDDNSAGPSATEASVSDPFAGLEAGDDLEISSGEGFGGSPGLRAKPTASVVVRLPTPLQTLVDRSQLASMGQLVGASYRVACEGLSRDRLNEILERCRRLLVERPWLESELRRRQIDLDQLLEGQSLEAVPELLAVEIYLACSQFGGRCEFERLG